MAKFFSGWFLFSLVVLLLCGAAVYYNVHLHPSPLPASNWWWFVAACALVAGARSYQRFVQGR